MSFVSLLSVASYVAALLSFLAKFLTFGTIRNVHLDKKICRYESVNMIQDQSVIFSLTGMVHTSSAFAQVFLKKFFHSATCCLRVALPGQSF